MGRKLLAEAKLSISVPSTVKCSLHSPAVSASLTTAAKNDFVRSYASSRSRLCVKVVGSKASSLGCMSRNQRNSRSVSMRSQS
jgi:hypothetical protein